MSHDNFLSSWTNDWFGFRAIEFNNQDYEGYIDNIIKQRAFDPKNITMG